MDGSWVAEREPPSIVDTVRLGRMRVFTEEIRRWQLPPGLAADRVLALFHPIA